MGFQHPIISCVFQFSTVSSTFISIHSFFLEVMFLVSIVSYIHLISILCPLYPLYPFYIHFITKYGTLLYPSYIKLYPLIIGHLFSIHLMIDLQLLVATRFQMFPAYPGPERPRWPRPAIPGLGTRRHRQCCPGGEAGGPKVYPGVALPRRQGG